EVAGGPGLGLGLEQRADAVACLALGALLRQPVPQAVAAARERAGQLLERGLGQDLVRRRETMRLAERVEKLRPLRRADRVGVQQQDLRRPAPEQLVSEA